MSPKQYVINYIYHIYDPIEYDSIEYAPIEYDPIEDDPIEDAPPGRLRRSCEATSAVAAASSCCSPTQASCNM